MAFLVKDAGFQAWGLVFVSLPLFVVGILVCLIWLRIILQFEVLISWRYEQLRAMELGMPDSYQLVRKEWETLFRLVAGRDRFGFSRLERWLPQFFLLLYATYGGGLVAATVLGWR